MTPLNYALASAAVLALSLVINRLAARQSAAIRHLILATAFAVVLALPLASAIATRIEPVRRITTSVILFVTPADAPATKETRSSRPAVHLIPLAIVVWAAGALLGGARLLTAIIWRRRISVPAAPRIRTAGTAIATELGIRRTVHFSQSGAILMPETRGALRPVVLLPASASEWTEDRLRIVLIHELTHVLRHDWFFGVIAELVSVLHWFNPLAWYGLRQLRREREMATDDALIAGGVDGCNYAGHLLGIVAGFNACADPGAVAMAQTSSLETRIRSILDPEIKRGGHNMKAKWTAAVTAVFLVIFIAGIQAPAQTGASAALSGRVLDASTALIPDASVLVKNMETGKREVVRTNEAGEFRFDSLPAGTYSIEIAVPGFQLFRQEAVTLAPGSAQTLDAVLNVGSIRETIGVTGKRTTPATVAQGTGEPTRLKIGGSVQAAKKIRMPPPSYPVHLKEAGIEGTVLLEAIIGRDGKVINVQPLNSMVHPDLIQAAIDAVRQWEYQPTLLNGNPVEIVTSVTVNFTLAP